LRQVLYQVIVHAQVHHPLLKDGTFLHEGDCVLHAFLQLLVFLYQLGNLLVLATDDLFQLFLLLLESFELIFIEFLELCEVGFCNFVVLLFALFVVDLGFHVCTLNFCPHFLHARLKRGQFVLELADFFQLLVALLLQLFD
jgi:hypothetical protein